MQLIGRMNCIKFINKSWSPFINITRQDPIRIMSIETLPFVLVGDDKYSVDKKTVYNTLCGPLVTLMCQFALKIGTSLKLQPTPRSLQDMVEILDEEPPQFFIRQAGTNVLKFYNKHQDKFEKVEYFSGSNVIDYQALSHIAYRAYPGEQDQFIYLKFLDFSLRLNLILTLLSISLTLMKINNRISIMDFIYNGHTLLTVLITSVYRGSLVQGEISMKKIMILGPWFLTAFFMTTVFNNIILDNLERAIPNQVIDSWEDLESNKQVKIIAEKVEFLTQFSKMSNSKMAANFRSRIQELNLENINNMTMMYGIANDLLTGRAAYVKNKVTIVYNILYLQAIFKLGNSLLDSLHLSKHGGPDEQYFIIIPSTTAKNLADEFNS